MPHATMKLIPGIDTNKTPALNEAAFSESQLVRFIYDRNGMGLVQKLGGWIDWGQIVIGSTINELHAWEDLAAVQRLAIGATNELSFITNSNRNYTNITPQINTSDAALTGINQSVTSFTVSGSVIVTPTIWSTGTAVFFTGGTMPSGITANQVYWIINSTIGGSNFQISASPPGTVQSAVAFSTTGNVSGMKISVSTVSVVQNSSIVYVTDTNLDVQSVSFTASTPTVVTAAICPPTGQKVYFSSASMPTGISKTVAYYVLPLTSTTFNIASTVGGSPVAASSTGSAVTMYSPDQIQIGYTIDIQTPISIQNILLNGTYSVSAAINGNNFFSVYSFDCGIIATASSVGVANSGANGPLLPTFVLSNGTNSVTVTEYNSPYIDQQVATFLYPTSGGGITIYGNYVATVTGNSTSVYTINTSAPASSNATLTMNNGFIHFVYYYNIPSVYGSSGYGAGGYGGYIPGNITATATSSTISGATMTLSGTITGTVAIGQLVTGTNVKEGTVIKSGSGTTWTVSPSGQSVSSTTLSFTPSTVGYGTGTKISYQTSNPVSGVVDWTINNFGEVLVACPQGGPIYYWSPTNNTTTAYLLTTAPLVNQGIFVAMPARQLVAYGSTVTGIQDPLLVRWSDAADATVWMAAANNQAGSYRIPEGSAIVGGIQGPQQAYLWTDLAVWAMQYVGLPNVYGFNKLADGVGLIGKKAVGLLGNAVYWMSPNNFNVMEGSGPKTIQCPIWDKVFQNINKNLYSLIRCATNSIFNEVTWYYPSAGSSYNDSYVKYDTDTQSWDYGKLDRTAWIDQSVLGTPIGSGNDNVIYQHEVGYNANTLPMTSSFRTGYMQLNEADNLVFVDQIWPDFKWQTSDGSTVPANVYITLYGTNYPGDDPIPYGPYSMTKEVQYISVRFRHRLMSIYISTADDTGTSDLNTFFRIGALRYRYQIDGKF